MPEYAKYLKTFKEMGVVHSIVSIKAKLEYQVMAFMFLGYAQNHIGGTYHMSNLRKKTYFTKPCRHMAEQYLHWIRIKKRTYQG